MKPSQCEALKDSHTRDRCLSSKHGEPPRYMTRYLQKTYPDRRRPARAVGLPNSAELERAQGSLAYGIITAEEENASLNSSTRDETSTGGAERHRLAGGEEIHIRPIQKRTCPLLNGKANKPLQKALCRALRVLSSREHPHLYRRKPPARWSIRCSSCLFAQQRGCRWDASGVLVSSD